MCILLVQHFITVVALQLVTSILLARSFLKHLFNFIISRFKFLFQILTATLFQVTIVFWQR